MKKSVRDTFFTVACAYFAYQLVGVAVKVPFAEWTGAIWANAVLGIVLGVFGIVYGVRAAREIKEEREQAAEEEAQVQHEKRTSVYTMDDAPEEADTATHEDDAGAQEAGGDIDTDANEAFSQQPEADAEQEGGETDDSL